MKTFLVVFLQGLFGDVDLLDTYFDDQSKCRPLYLLKDYKHYRHVNHDANSFLSFM